MPYNGSGVFSIINTFVANTTILSAAVNANFSDIATGLSDCLTRDNQAGMTAVFRAVSGSSSAPGISFNSDTATGVYLPSTGVLGLVAKALGVKINAEIFQAQSAVISAGGSGYVVGDTITLTGGTFVTPVVLTVATLSGSAVATVTTTVGGLYTAKPSNPVSQGSTSGAGTGATFTVTWNDPTSADYRLGITNLSDTSILPAMGVSSFVDGLKGKANGYDFAVGIGGANLILATGVSPAPQGLQKNLTVIVASNTTVAITADAVVLFNGTASYQLVTSVSLTCNLGTTGANALDTGTIAVDSWYFMFVISKADGTKACLASLSSTSPSLPAGYLFYARVGAVKTIHSSAILYGTRQLGRRAQYVVGLAQTTVIPTIATNTTGTYSDSTPTYSSTSVAGGNVQSSVVPTTASEIYVVLSNSYGGGTSGNVIVAPNTGYSGRSTSNPPYAFTIAGTGTIIPASMVLESTSIAIAIANNGGWVGCSGWVDSI